MASLQFQEKYVIGGTIDSYLTAEDLLEQVDSLKHLVTRPENTPSVSSEQLAALKRLFSYIEGNANKALSADSQLEAHQNIREGEVWINLRTQAAEALELFGVNSQELSLRDIESMSEL